MQLKRTKVLVVDDSRLILRFVQDCLSARDWEVETSDNVFVAPQVNTWEPDLILMDVGMGEEKGTTAVTMLRTLAAGRRATILLHSSLPADTLSRLAADCGADGFIEKTQDRFALYKQCVKALTAGTPAAA